ncbi:MAG: macro domain-containing protein [Thermoplasmata archaeon]
MKKNKVIGNTSVEIYKGEITKLDEKVDAIVVPANIKLHMDTGVAALVKMKGGDAIDSHVGIHAPANFGDAIVSIPGKLKVKHIIHAVINDENDRTDKEKIVQALKNTLKVASELDLKKLAIPALGLGVGGMPFEESARIMHDTIVGFLTSEKEKTRLEKIYITVYSDEAKREFERVF